MFIKTNLKLTFLYSLMFFLCVWILSITVYYWMNSQLGEGYLNQLIKICSGDSKQCYTKSLTEEHLFIVNTASAVAIYHLKEILIFINLIFILIIPVIAWRLSSKSLFPLREIHQRQKQFVSDVSHELKTPLSVISGEIEISLSKKHTSGEYTKILFGIKSEIERLSKLVDHLLFFVRESPDRGAMIKENIDLIDIITKIIAKTRILTIQKQQQIIFNPPENNRLYLGNESLIEQLIFNIVNNAITYTPRKGIIKISIMFHKNDTAIKIKDTGIGIRREIQDKIFDRFYRGDESRTQIKGYGLGLAIAKEIVDKHNGTLTVSSVLNKGSTFTITLPAT